ncbi:unnamed protein product [Arctia plantaginis]|uniref:PDZ domain-containing protein n=1 Tax=Arctia plantaginis TaxID=874455 RepID=A0A8S1B6G8_ARCPL|nr:unnamed protein product [Arctia plantaginis]
MAEVSTMTTDEEYSEGVRMLMLNLPEDEGEGLGFRLTRTLWDPYPWVREVTSNSRADTAGLKTGDCLLQADGKDLLGMPVGQIAGLIRGDGAGRAVALLVWNCGVDPRDDPELLWSCGGGVRGEKARRALAGVVKALTCSVCASTATKPLTCARSHIYCEPCWMRLERCALCRESLPSKASPYARNLVAEQVFEAIATEYELKNPRPKPLTQTTSAYSSPNRSPNLSPSPSRRGQYQHSMIRHKKIVHFPEKFGQIYASDPNIHRSVQNTEHQQSANPTVLVENSCTANSSKSVNCSCQNGNENSNNKNVPQIKVENAEDGSKTGHANSDCSSSCQSLTIPHKLVARLRQACSLADLQNVAVQCPLSRSLNSLGDHSKHEHHGSLDNLKTLSNNSCDSQIFLLPAPPIYVLACNHNQN